jgi:CrcB protein
VTVWLWIALAGAVGTLCRYALGRWILTATGGGYPWGTFAANALGCFAIGLVAAAIEKEELMSPAMRLAIIVGFLGGFTTFSSFALESFALAKDGAWLAAAGYVLLSNSVGLAAVWMGHRIVYGTA